MGHHFNKCYDLYPGSRLGPKSVMSNNFGCFCFLMVGFSDYLAWFVHLCSYRVPRSCMISWLCLSVVTSIVAGESECLLPTDVPLETSGARTTASIRNVQRATQKQLCPVQLVLLHSLLISSLLPPSPSLLPCLSQGHVIQSWCMAPKETVLDFQS